VPSSAPDKPTFLLLLDAISRRRVAAALGLCAADCRLVVRGAPGTDAGNHVELWRDVSLRGSGAIRGYVDELLSALPALTLVAKPVRREGELDILALEVSGVDAEGAPYLAYACARIRTDGRLIHELRLDVTHVAVGPELLTRAGDPKRFFTYFLAAGGANRPGLPERGAA
jgi:hypothetical protein